MAEIQAETTHFSVDSSLLFQLGEQLVAKPSVALAELVKNGYDADATEVTVTLENVGDKGGNIFIEDNGHGITYDEFDNGWMRIATSTKLNTTVSRFFRRPLTGAKGIGRFAARRLGLKLELQSVAANKLGEKQMITASFDWTKFVPGTDVTSIPVTYRVYDMAQNEPTGTKLLITQARDSWSKEDVVDLRRDLFSIQSPFPDLVTKTQFADEGYDPGFNLSLVIPGDKGLEKYSGNLGESFLQLHWAYLDGQVDAFGNTTYTLKIQTEDTNTSFTDDTEIYKDIPNAQFRIYFFTRNIPIPEGSFTARDIGRKGRTSGGVRVYLDGFRVFPYGEIGNDWLDNNYYASENVNMALRLTMSSAVTTLAEHIRSESPNPNERPFLLIPRNNQLFGAVFISRELQPSIQITASREGLVENEAFEELRRFIQRGIYWMTIKYAEFTSQTRYEKRRQRRDNASATDILSRVKEDVERLATVATEAQSRPAPDQTDAQLENVVQTPTGSIRQLQADIQNQLDEASRSIAETNEGFISDIAMLRLLASAGTSLLLMQHQLRTLIDDITGTEGDLDQLRNDIPNPIRYRYDAALSQISAWRDLVSGQATQLAALISPDNRERRRRLALRQVVDEAKRPFEYYMDRYHVTFSNDVLADLRTPPIYKAELYAILLNLLTNSLKAVYSFPERQIVVRAERRGNILSFEMWNTGKRVPEHLREEYFRPFVNDRNDNPIFGPGTGLGLAIVRDIVETYHGSASFVDIPLPWQTGVKITLPYS